MTAYRMVIALVSGLAALVPARSSEPGDKDWTRDFAVDKSDLASAGRNTYFILEPGYRLTQEAGNERLVINVLNETRAVDGVETRVVEERETKGGKLVEVSRNYIRHRQDRQECLLFRRGRRHL